MRFARSWHLCPRQAPRRRQILQVRVEPSCSWSPDAQPATRRNCRLRVDRFPSTRTSCCMTWVQTWRTESSRLRLKGLIGEQPRFGVSVSVLDTCMTVEHAPCRARFKRTVVRPRPRRRISAPLRPRTEKLYWLSYPLSSERLSAPATRRVHVTHVCPARTVNLTVEYACAANIVRHSGVRLLREGT
jgi:hypothetical protein